MTVGYGARRFHPGVHPVTEGRWCLLISLHLLEGCPLPLGRHQDRSGSALNEERSSRIGEGPLCGSGDGRGVLSNVDGSRRACRDRSSSIVMCDGHVRVAREGCTQLNLARGATQGHPHRMSVPSPID